MLITFLPEIVLCCCLPVLALVRFFRTSATPKTYFTLSKYFMLASVLLSIILYDKSELPGIYDNSRYTTLFKCLVFLFSFVWFFLAYRWFLHEERSSFRYFMLSISSLICLDVIISAHNFALLWGALALHAVLVYFLILRRLDDERIFVIAHRYAGFAAIFLLLMAAGIIIFYRQTESLNYLDIFAFLHQGADIPRIYLYAASMILAGMLFFMAAAPFHFWFLDVVRYSILPVGGYLTLAPVLAYFAAFCTMTINVFFPIYGHFQQPLIIFAVASLFFGAIGANGEKNILRLFAYGSVFNVGFILISLITFSTDSLFSSFVYLLVYLMSMLGIYTVFLGFKSQGRYVFELREFAGIAKQKAYLAAALLMFLVSLIGSPPMLGFLGKLSVINNLVLEHHFYLVAVALLSLILMANAYLVVVKTVYFDSPIMNFDRIDKSIYICLTLNLILVVISLVQPRFLMSGFERMLIRVF